MPKKYHKKTAEEKQEEIKILTESMDKAIENYFTDPQKMKEYLRFMGQFYRYSPGNMALIQSQFQGAQAVGSFKFWKEKGYSVNKGEHGLKVWVPVKIAAKFKNEKGQWKNLSEATDHEREQIKNGSLRATSERTGFTSGHVFDIQQTNCPIDKIPELFPNRHFTGEIKNYDRFVSGLYEVAKDIGVTIEKISPYEQGAAKGAFYPLNNTIVLNPRNTDFERATVLVHELAHATMHTWDKFHDTTTSEKEFQAEMASYVVNSHFGINTKEESLHYLSSWSKNKTLSDKKKLIGEVHQTSLRFINIIEKSLENERSVTTSQENTKETEPTYTIHRANNSNHKKMPAARER